MMFSPQALHFGSVHYMGDAPPPPPPPPPMLSAAAPVFQKPHFSYNMMSSLPMPFKQTRMAASNWGNNIYKVMYNSNPQHSYDDQNEPDVSILRSPPTPLRSSLRSRTRPSSRSRSGRTSHHRSRSRSNSQRRVSFAEDEASRRLTRRNTAPARSYSSIDSIGSFRIYDDRSRSPSPLPRKSQPSYTGVADDSRTRPFMRESFSPKQTSNHTNKQRRKRHSKRGDSKDGDRGRSSGHDHNRKQRLPRLFSLRGRIH